MELADVDAPCGDVGGHHDLHLSRLEIAQGPLALPLRLVSVDRFAAYASPFQHAGDVVRAVLRARENEHRLVRLLSEHRYQQALFLRPLDKVDALIHPIDGGRSGRYLDPYRIAQDGARQSHDIPGHGGREKKRLAPDRKQRQQAPDIGDKAHVEHPVRLVQHEMRQVPEFDLSLSDQVEQTSGSGDQNIDAPAEPVRLRSLLDSPENRRVLQARILSVIGERLADLKGELPRGGQNEGPNSTAAAFSRATFPSVRAEAERSLPRRPTVPVRGIVPRSVSARGAGRTPPSCPCRSGRFREYPRPAGRSE